MVVHDGVVRAVGGFQGCDYDLGGWSMFAGWCVMRVIGVDAGEKSVMPIGAFAVGSSYEQDVAMS